MIMALSTIYAASFFYFLIQEYLSIKKEYPQYKSTVSKIFAAIFIMSFLMFTTGVLEKMPLLIILGILSGLIVWGATLIRIENSTSENSDINSKEDITKEVLKWIM